MLGLMASMALAVAVNSSDHVAFNLPGHYAIQFNTRYVGSQRRRSVSLVNTTGAFRTAESDCASDTAAKASAGVLTAAESDCASDTAAKASQNWTNTALRALASLF